MKRANYVFLMVKVWRPSGAATVSSVVPSALLSKSMQEADM